MQLMNQSGRAATIVITLALVSLLGSTITTAKAQGQLQASSPPPDSVVALVAEAQGLPFVPPDQRPFFGTFWEVHSSLPCVDAPLPFPPPTLQRRCMPSAILRSAASSSWTEPEAR